MKKQFLTLFCLLSLTTPVLTQADQATDLKLLGTYGDWNAFTFKEKDGPVCFMSTKPKKSEGKYAQRGDVHAFVTHRPKLKSFNIVEFLAGYDFKPGSTVALQIGNQTFTLQTKEDSAWIDNAQTNAKIIAELKKGSTMIVKGTSKKGTLTTDTYSLKGSGNAYKAISDACPMK